MKDWAREFEKVIKDYKRETGRKMIPQRILRQRLNLRRVEFNSLLMNITYKLPIYESDKGSLLGLLGGKR